MWIVCVEGGGGGGRGREEGKKGSAQLRPGCMSASSSWTNQNSHHHGTTCARSRRLTAFIVTSWQYFFASCSACVCLKVREGRAPGSGLLLGVTLSLPPSTKWNKTLRENRYTAPHSTRPHHLHTTEGSTQVGVSQTQLAATSTSFASSQALCR